MKKATKIRITSCVIIAMIGLKAGYFSATRIWSVQFPWTLLFMAGYAAFAVGLVLLITRERPSSHPKPPASVPPKDIHTTNGVCRNHH